MPILWILVTAHALWAYVVYSHLLLQHISSVNCPLCAFMNQETSIRLCYGPNILHIYTEMFEFLLLLLLNGSILSLQTNILCILYSSVELWLYFFFLFIQFQCKTAGSCLKAPTALILPLQFKLAVFRASPFINLF